MSAAPLIVSSVLSADQGQLAQECADLAAAGADRIHWDVMDGRFVPNLTFGPAVIAACLGATDTPFEAHLMVASPEELVPHCIEAGCETVIVHAEACAHLHRTLGWIRQLGVRSGVAINPATGVWAVEHVLDEADLVLVMTVNPGFGGQAYLPAMEPKISRLRELIDRSGREIDLEVDGGVTDATIGRVAAAGADVFVSGSWLYGQPDGKANAVARLRSLARAEPDGGAETPRPAPPSAALAAPPDRPGPPEHQQQRSGSVVRATRVRSDGTVRARKIEFRLGAAHAGRTVHVVSGPDAIRFFDTHGVLIVEHPWPAPGVTYVGNGRPSGRRRPPSEA